MPIKRLPESLVQRLRQLVKKSGKQRAFTALGRMENIDHRRDYLRVEGVPHKHSTTDWGRRVRQMNVSRNYPNVDLVIKRTHGFSAEEAKAHLEEEYRQFNQAKPTKFVLKKPIVYVIGPDLLAMSRADFPSIAEVIGGRDYESPRGTDFFHGLETKHGISREDLRVAFKEWKKGHSFKRNTLLLGFQKGKFIFMQLPDIY